MMTTDPRRGGIGDAFALATIAHQGQTYGDRPYIDHPVAVARLLAVTFGPYDHLLIPALLHDVVEDTPIELIDIERMGFSSEVIATIDGVTRQKGEPYAEFIDRAAGLHNSLIIKLADNTHNLSTLPAGDRREQRYLRARERLVSAWGDTDPWADIIANRPGAR